MSRKKKRPNRNVSFWTAGENLCPNGSLFEYFDLFPCFTALAKSAHYNKWYKQTFCPCSCLGEDAHMMSNKWSSSNEGRLAFRTLVRKYSCDLCYTPMIVAADFVRSVKARDSEFTTNQGDCPLIVQFAANDARLLSDAAQIICPYASGIDINCGCPQRWAVAEGYGACLINKPELIQDMVKQVRNQVENPRFSVSIKIRIHDDLRRTIDLCQKAEATGVSWITVHGRTTEERHQPVHYDAIRMIKESVSIPVVANGDIRNLKEAETVWQMTGTDGVMVARGLLANPAMFAGYEETPLKCIWDWADIALELGTPFMCFHQHLMYMMEKITSRQEKRVFNALSSTSAVLDYLTDNYGI